MAYKILDSRDIDQTYNPESENAQSGKAVAEALKTIDVGGVEYELINTIKVAPDENGNLPTSIIFTKDSNGKPFELTDFCLNAVFGSTDGNSSRVSMKVNDGPTFGNANLSLLTTLKSWYCNWINFGETTGSICIAPNTSVNTSNMPSTPNISINGLLGCVVQPTFKGYYPISKIEFFLSTGTNKTFIENSEFRIYGVRK